MGRVYYPAHIATTGIIVAVGSSNMGDITPTRFLVDETLTPTKNDLIELFIKKQIELWGFESVQRMFDQGFEPKVANDKVLWVK